MPVYKELEQDEEPREEPGLRRRRNPVASFLEGWTPFKRKAPSTPATSDEELGRRPSSEEQYFDIVSSLEFKEEE